MTKHLPLLLASVVVSLTACGAKTTSDTRGVASPAASTPAASAPEAAPAGSSGPVATPPAVASTSGRPGCTQSFAAFDADGDGRVSREEFLARPHALPEPESVFSARDGDGDGALTAVEFCTGWAAGCSSRMSGGPGMGDAAGSGPGRARMGAARGPGMGMGPMVRGGGPRCDEHFTRFDADGDGSVTEPELGAFPHPHGDAHELFAARDENHDGRLTRAEFCAPWSTPSTPVQPTSP